MINVLVTIEVKDFDSLTSFECKANEIMGTHGGKIASAFETKRNEDNSGQEVHLLEFPNEKSFSEYRSDPRLAKLIDLRNQAISSINVATSLKLKTYA